MVPCYLSGQKPHCCSSSSELLPYRVVLGPVLGEKTVSGEGPKTGDSYNKQVVPCLERGDRGTIMEPGPGKAGW